MKRDDLSWDVYRTFLAVLEEGSLSGAARRRGLTQPSVGRHVDRLEDALGFQLFTRTRLGLEPTDAARDLKPFAATMAAQADALLRMGAAQAGGVRGVVRISASDVIGVETAPKILTPFLVAYPDVEIELSLSDALVDLLRREADIAVRMTDPTQSALVVQKAGDIRLGLFARGDYLARRGRPESLSDLRGHALIGYDKETAFLRAMKEAHPAFADLAFTFRADSNLAQLSAIRAGMGLGVCQTGLAEAPVKLTRVLADVVDVRLPCYVAMHENLRTTPAYRAVFQALAAGLKRYALFGRLDGAAT
jgi:DNA-binding transcriptional LysR family regulator